MAAFGRNEVDVIDLERTRPAVGASALRTGIVLVGDEDHVEALRESLESRTSSLFHAERRRQLDEIIVRLEEAT